ncbi:hypothetical protein [Pontimicrobium sp. MEBiC01747]
MKNTFTIPREILVIYFKRYKYHSIYFTKTADAFYNPRNRQTLLLPKETETFSKEEAITMFTESKATDLPPEIEGQRQVLFTQLYKYLKITL